MSEAQEQAALFEWAEWMQGRCRPLKYMHHIPNGGRRDAATGAILKRQGVKAGVPDVFLPLPVGGFHGLYIEMKYGRNKLTKEQRDFFQYAASVGYKVATCYNADEAIQAIRSYLTIGMEKPK